jgi:osmoprotectant transport system ATP-binding protein
VFVTHDIFEAVRLGDRIALLDRGRLQQVATPAELVEQPANAFVEQFLGEHRFHLRLLTQTIRGLREWMQAAAEPPAEDGAAEHLHLHHTILQAFDIFRRAGRPMLPVYEGERFRGMLTRSVLIEQMGEMIGNGGRS